MFTWLYTQLLHLTDIYVYVVLPWLLPKRLYDLLIAVFAADSANTASVLESVPIFGHFIRFAHSNYQDWRQVADCVVQLECTNRCLLDKLHSVQSELKLLSEQNSDFQSDLFEMQKRLMDMQEDSLRQDPKAADGIPANAIDGDDAPEDDLDKTASAFRRRSIFGYQL